MAGAGGTMGEISDVALRHGTGVWGEPELLVTTHFAVEGFPDQAVSSAARYLDAGQPYEQWSADVLDPERIVARHEGRWRPHSFPVEGRDQVFWHQEKGERWAAYARVGSVRVVVAASRWDPGDVRLAVVDGLAYVVGGTPPAGSAGPGSAPAAGSGSTTSR